MGSDCGSATRDELLWRLIAAAAAGYIVWGGYRSAEAERARDTGTASAPNIQHRQIMAWEERIGAKSTASDTGSGGNSGIAAE